MFHHSPRSKKNSSWKQENNKYAGGVCIYPELKVSAEK